MDDDRSDNPMLTVAGQQFGALEMFLNSIGSRETKNKYRNKIETFLKFVGLQGSLQQRAQEFVELASKDNKWAFGCVAQFLMSQKARYDGHEITAGTLKNYYKPLRVFCEANDIALSWLKITRGLPKPRKFAQDRAPTSDEIRKLMDYPDRRIKPIVLMMSSAGFRVGAWDYLRWGHIECLKRDDDRIIAAQVRIYAGEAEEYKSFITPEAYAAVKEWMDFRQECGEKITGNSWVMRDIFKTAALTYGAHFGMACAPRQLKSSGIRNMLKRAWIAQGLMKQREMESKNNASTTAAATYEFKSSHGFRKRFKTQCEIAGVKPLNIECMLGHDTGIAGSSYYRPTDREMLDDYLKAVDALTISNVQVVRLENERLMHRNSELEQSRGEVEKLRKELGPLLQLKETLIKQGILKEMP